MNLDALVVLCWCSGCVVPTRFNKAYSSQGSSELAVLNLDAVVVFVLCMTSKCTADSNYFVTCCRCSRYNAPAANGRLDSSSASESLWLPHHIRSLCLCLFRTICKGFYLDLYARHADFLDILFGFVMMCGLYLYVAPCGLE